ncbi:MAG: T9SS type A sorting domain-containing protein [Bacteroidetes bacterium]|nr:T9SS type A sorting domain-containing protein [Bacteroidota bacterium]MBL0033749.1 T9SS type A sorting domain-containing protein [Bacteroidota bacterium]
MLIKILDLHGRVVYLNMIPKNAKNLDVNSSEFESGSYLVQVYSSEALISVKKLLIVK